ncbi:MAG: NAD-dependent epimerase/dehydratase family protein [Candidatus Lokiarchaeota archaeon]|nr:NAD-dependent epimerase/dehydratase family protein [Candidatus Lokiarchaeota archaeon]
MSKKILVTGGSGFIGSNLVNKLVNENKHEITILDCLYKDIHRKKSIDIESLNKNVKFVHASACDYKIFKELIQENEIIYHMAAILGIPQSMYRISSFFQNNVLSTANLMDILVNCDNNIEKVIITSSNTVYGEGKYICDNCGIVYPQLRSKDQLKKKQWEIKCPNCKNTLIPEALKEDDPTNPSSIYALTKQIQEQMSLMIGKTYGIDITILRLFLVYGVDLNFYSPYTGVASIFCNKLLRGKNPIVYEDGYQSRDFINIRDVCNSLILSMEKKTGSNEIFNVGSGYRITIRDVAETLTQYFNDKVNPNYTNEYRLGDIRHSFADISKIKSKLNFTPTISFKQGINEYMKSINNIEGKCKLPV